MFNIPEVFTALFALFSPLFSARVWVYAQLLLIGAILCPGKRTVTAALRVLGLSDAPNFINYHRVLNRARWSCRQAAKILLGLVIELLPPGLPIRIGIDETIERRKGEKIKAKGVYRDAVRSSQKHVIRCFGLKWISMMVIVPLPWSQRCWALPFLTVLAPPKATNLATKGRHKTTVDWTIQMVKQVSRWLKRPWVCIGDGAYACVRLGWACIKHDVTLISRLRLDAQLYDFPTQPPAGKRGPKPSKGKRLPSLATLNLDDHQSWETVKLNWYGNTEQIRQVLTGTALWYTRGEKPMPIRWVMVTDPEDKDKTDAFFSTKLELDPILIVEWFVLRWSVEVTFEEVRAHLGVETQRQWSDLAIARTTPILFGLFSLVCVIANHLSQTVEIIPEQTSWYSKDEVTFSDVLTIVRQQLWKAKFLVHSTRDGKYLLFPKQDWEYLIARLATAA